MSVFGGKGETGRDRLVARHAEHRRVHRDLAEPISRGPVTKAPGEASGVGGVPTMWLPTAAQERQRTGSSKAAPSILPKSATHRRREAAAEADRKEAASVIQRAAAAKADAETQAAEVTRKAAEAERMRKADEALKIRRTAHIEACRRTLDINATLPTVLSARDRRVFALLTVRYTDAGAKPVELVAADVATALDIPQAAAATSIQSLREHGAIVDVRDEFGVTRFLPAPHVKATVTAGARRQ